jgi:hypothetical protein
MKLLWRAGAVFTLPAIEVRRDGRPKGEPHQSLADTNHVTIARVL